MNEYALAGNTPETSLITIHQAEDYEAMRTAGRLAAEILDFIVPYVKPDVTTGELDQLCHEYTVERGAIPAPLMTPEPPGEVSLRHRADGLSDPSTRRR